MLALGIKISSIFAPKLFQVMNAKNYTEEEIRKIKYVMTRKANDWLLSGGRCSDGVEVYQTSDDEIFIIKDIETSIKLGMRKEGKKDDYLIKMSFFELPESEEIDKL